ncbi:MAG: enoyl-CoA hydratase/isomerase family protein [Candidatus Thorarchaeota archaeon]|nr:MAG: enoyl-CoA hydratase/isomerase family protein [Candidatus Thorarchaeota archaeon]
MQKNRRVLFYPRLGKAKVMKKLNNWISREDEDGQIVWFLLNRPDKRNAFGDEVAEEFVEFIDGLKSNSKIRVLVISSALDEVFTAGADIKELMAIYEDEPYSAAFQMSKTVQTMFAKLENLPIPVISAVKGLCLTAGLEMSMCCDVIVAADNAKFGQIETKYGIIPGGGGTQRLTRLVGSLKARELIYTCDIIDAPEAQRIGLVNLVVPLSELEESVNALCRRIIKRPKLAITRAKELTGRAFYENPEGYGGENRGFGETFATGEPLERLSEFIKPSKGKKDN